jgi:hypothetical protein
MGKVFKPKGAVKRKNMIDEAVKDLSPGIREAAGEILESWKGEESEKMLVALLGGEGARRIQKKAKFKTN